MTDVLPPHAAFEADTVEALVAIFATYGYERVKPPLVEFEETLLSGSGAALADQTFKLVDPLSQRTLALRSDMTMQIARIATTRLANRPRPLRLSCAGQVVRVVGSELRAERQFGQVGAELVGVHCARADVEIITMAAGALARLGARGLSVDLGLPTLVSFLVPRGSCSEDAARRLRAALDCKDADAVAALADDIGADTARLLGRVVAAAGSPEETIAALDAASLPPGAEGERAALVEVFERIRRNAAWLDVSIDVVEYRGLEYHSGVTFSLSAKTGRGERARGGRYLAGDREPAPGATLIMDTVLESLPRRPAQRRVFVPLETSPEQSLRLRADGWITVHA
ncbi:MAG: ATP phosphoribosyltransferase regulatory subunit, partial [Rhodospirillales bacterium]|nr:ATP phosphoribosyltransferase regulatory subunit [Rhodospirillales bacterium]